jgi:hypothetical protein
MRRRIGFFLLLLGLPASQGSLAAAQRHSPKIIPALDCPPSTSNGAGKSKCDAATAKVTIATPEELYEATANAIVKLRDDEFGFPADIAVAAFELKHPSGIKDVGVVEDLQSIKRFSATPSPRPTLVAVDVPTLGLHLYPAELIRALFMTELFPSTLKVVEWWSKQNAPESMALYILLDSNKAKEALKILQAKASPSQDHPAVGAVLRLGRSTFPEPPALLNASYSPGTSFRLFSEGVFSQDPEHEGQLADPKWFPSVPLGQFNVKMTIDENRWNCDEWTKIVHSNSSTAVTGRLNQLGDRGCTLGLIVSVPRGLDHVIEHIAAEGRIWGEFGDRIRCNPDDFMDPPQTGVNNSTCTNGHAKWEISEDAIAKNDRSADAKFYVSIAVPYFNSVAKRPNIALAVFVAMEGHPDPLGKDNRACLAWNSPPLDACIAELTN